MMKNQNLFKINDAKETSNNHGKIAVGGRMAKKSRAPTIDRSLLADAHYPSLTHKDSNLN